jgi:hypothetical protein
MSALTLFEAAVFDEPTSAYTRKYTVVFCGRPEGVLLVPVMPVTEVELVKSLDVEYSKVYEVAPTLAFQDTVAPPQLAGVAAIPLGTVVVPP